MARLLSPWVGQLQGRRTTCAFLPSSDHIHRARAETTEELVLALQLKHRRFTGGVNALLSEQCTLYPRRLSASMPSLILDLSHRRCGHFGNTDVLGSSSVSTP